MEQQRHFDEWPISELHGKVDSIQINLKLLFTSAIMECRLCFQLRLLHGQIFKQTTCTILLHLGYLLYGQWP